MTTTLVLMDLANGVMRDFGYHAPPISLFEALTECDPPIAVHEKTWIIDRHMVILVPPLTCPEFKALNERVQELLEQADIPIAHAWTVNMPQVKDGLIAAGVQIPGVS